MQGKVEGDLTANTKNYSKHFYEIFACCERLDLRSHSLKTKLLVSQRHNRIEARRTTGRYPATRSGAHEKNAR